jgi:serine protease AprX
MSKKKEGAPEIKFVSDNEMAKIKKTLVKVLGKKATEKVIPKLDRRLAKILAEKKVAAEKEAKIKVIISLAKSVKVPTQRDRPEILKEMQKEASEDQKSIVELLHGLGVKEIRQLSIVNAVVAILTPDQILSVAEREDVKIMRLSTKEKVICVDDSVPLINTPAVWNMGYGGKGIKVAVIDTGIDKNHPALSGKVVSEVSTHSEEGVNTPGSHGTHCAGIIASNDASYKGVSPDVDLINVKVLTGGSPWDEGYGEAEDVIMGIQEAVNRGADVISMSLGWSHIGNGWECSDGYCILCEAVDNAVKAGVVVVVAAGNENTAGSTSGADTNLRCPGNARSVITVGGTDKKDNMYADWTYSASSIGPTSYGLSKPDIVAPGKSIRSTVLNNQWGLKTGTSMSTPHVAGICALMLDKNPTLSCADIKNLLKQTAVDLGFDQNAQGAGRVNAEMAVKAVPALRKRVLASSGTMVVDLVRGQEVNWTPAIPCWRHPNWYQPNMNDITQGVIWIWSSYWVTQEEAQKGAIRIFRKIFDLRGTGKIVSGEMKVAADNRAIAILNGAIVKEKIGFQTLSKVDVTKHLIEEDVNELKFIVFNRAGSPKIMPLTEPRSNPAGLIYKLELTTQR